MTDIDLSPGSPAWLRLITASKVPAILGEASPWDSPRSLWHLMRGDVEPEPTTDVQRRGHYLESGVLAWFRDQHPEFTGCWEQFYATRPDIPWGAATVDALLFKGPVQGVADAVPGEKVLVEIKTDINADEWGAPGTDEVPLRYIAQVMWQLAMAPGIERAYIAVLTPFLNFAEYVVERDEEAIAGLIAMCQRFYESLSGDVPPPLDNHPRTYEVLRRVHPDIEDGTEVELDPATAREFVEATRDLKAATARATGAKSALLDALGHSKRAVCAGQVIAQRQNTAAGVPALYPARKAVDLDALPQTTEGAAA